MGCCSASRITVTRALSLTATNSTRALSLTATNSTMATNSTTANVLSSAAQTLAVDPSERTVKVVATMGPAWDSAERIVDMVNAGVGIVRLNCSHRVINGKLGEFERIAPLVRAAAAATGKTVEILGDLQGPKFRVHDIAANTLVNLTCGHTVTLAIAVGEHDIVRDTPSGVRITMKPTREQNALLAALEVGTIVLIEDGRLKIKVTERVSATEVLAQVVVGGRMKARQGVNVPSLSLDCPALTEKDIEDAEFMLALDPPVEYIAMSFVQSAADIQELIDLMDRLAIPADRRPKICPKIEKPLALENLSEILDLCGSMMVARGDLGVEMGLEQVPMAQKLMIHMAKAKGISPIINATQMMESMMKCQSPQRSEVSDVANAVWDGADAVMLSGEAAMGQWPCQTVATMATIALQAQKRAHQVEPTFAFDKPAPDMSVVFGPAGGAVEQPLAPAPSWALNSSSEQAAPSRTRVLATLGPASQNVEMLSKLVSAGVEIFRLNCAYRKPERPNEFQQIVSDIHAAGAAAGKKLQIMADLVGPKFRIGGVFWTGVRLEERWSVTLAIASSDVDLSRMDPVSGGVLITLPPSRANGGLLRGLQIGDIVNIEEGKKKLRVTHRASGLKVKCEVIAGGRLNPNTAISCAGVTVDCPAITEKDEDDIRFLLALEPPIDYLAVSFCQNADDIDQILDVMDDLEIPEERRPKILPRIERPEALRNLDEIVEASDGLIVARGELGDEMGNEGVPYAQKVMIKRAKQVAEEGDFEYPVFVSTQIMESMIKNAVPTRAEVNDAINAVWDGADVLMCSGETAKGMFPMEGAMSMISCARVADAQKIHL